MKSVKVYKGQFNGKPVYHWGYQIAHELVVYADSTSETVPDYNIHAPQALPVAPFNLLYIYRGEYVQVARPATTNEVIAAYAVNRPVNREIFKNFNGAGYYAAAHWSQLLPVYVPNVGEFVLCEGEVCKVYGITNTKRTPRYHLLRFGGTCGGTKIAYPHQLQPAFYSTDFDVQLPVCDCCKFQPAEDESTDGWQYHSDCTLCPDCKSLFNHALQNDSTRILIRLGSLSKNAACYVARLVAEQEDFYRGRGEDIAQDDVKKFRTYAALPIVAQAIEILDI